MAISDKKIKEFFGKQRIGSTDSLKPHPIKKINNTKKEDEQSVSNPLAKREQSVSNPLAKREQSVSNPLAKREQSVSRLSTIKSDQKTSEKPTQQELLNVKLYSFVGKERELLDFIFWKCNNNCSLESPPITTNEIMASLKISSNDRIRNLIFRVSHKSGIEVIHYKTGRNPCRIFQLPKNLYQNILDEYNRNRPKLTPNPLAKALAKPLANIDSSSSYYNKTTTTTEKNDLPEEWNNIKYDLLENIGFYITQLKQLYGTRICNPSIVQSSINHFAFALENNEKIKFHNNPLNLFMGVLRKGHAWVESNYESPQDRALRELLERKKAEKEKREVKIRELYNLLFEEWRDSFSEQELADLYKKICPKGGIKYRDKNNPLNRATFSNYFEANIWPEKRKELGLNELIKNE